MDMCLYSQGNDAYKDAKCPLYCLSNKEIYSLVLISGSVAIKTFWLQVLLYVPV